LPPDWGEDQLHRIRFVYLRHLNRAAEARDQRKAARVERLRRTRRKDLMRHGRCTCRTREHERDGDAGRECGETESLLDPVHVTSFASGFPYCWLDSIALTARPGPALFLR